MVHSIYVVGYDVSQNATFNATASTELALTEVSQVITQILPEVVTHPTNFNYQRTAITIKPLISGKESGDENGHYTLEFNQESCEFFKFNLWINAIVLKVSFAWLSGETLGTKRY